MTEKSTLNTIIVAILLIFLYPIGLIVMWILTKWPKWVKWLISLPLVIAISGVLIITIISIFNPSKLLPINLRNTPTPSSENFFGNTNDALDKQAMYDISQLRSALELYKADYQKYPSSLKELAPKYVPTIKQNPYNHKDYYYKITQDEKYVLSTDLSTGEKYTQASP